MSKQDFQNKSEFDYVWVDQVERVYVDDIQEEDLYMVTYLVEGECAGWGGADACELVPFCEYVWVDVSPSKKEYFYLRMTGVSCDEDIEEVLKPTIIDEF